jgi:hypothetical protein
MLEVANFVQLRNDRRWRHANPSVILKYDIEVIAKPYMT